MTENVHQLRPKPGDTEKITINLGYIDLGHIDLMVQEGFYSNRTDFIRTAIRNQLERHADVVKQTTVRKNLDLGLRHYSREDLEAVRLAGEMLHIHVLGLASIALDVTPELARATIASVVVLGALHASPAVKAALADRMRMTSDAALGIRNDILNRENWASSCGRSIVSEQKEALDMNDMPNPNTMLEATRLTRAGRLSRSHGAPSAHASRRDRARHDIRHRR